MRQPRRKSTATERNSVHLRDSTTPLAGEGRALSLDLLPVGVRDLYETHEWRHACSVLHSDFPDEWGEIVDVLGAFRVYRSDILTPGGRKSRVAGRLDGQFYRFGWVEKQFDTKMVVDTHAMESPTHKVDCFKNRVALELEWNNKDPFYDRDLNNFRLLFELRAISVGIIITRCDELQDVVAELGRGKSFGSSTTHMSKLLPRIEGGGGGGCPLLVFGITRKLIVDGNAPDDAAPGDEEDDEDVRNV